MTTRQDTGVLQVLDFVFWGPGPIKKKDNLCGVLFKAQAIMLLQCLVRGKSGFVQMEPVIPIVPFLYCII